MSQIQRVRGDQYVDTNPQNVACWHVNMLTDQTSTGRPVTVDQKEEHNIDFRVSGPSHSVVQETEHIRVQELQQRIENHPHRAALQADLQQNNIYNPFSENSKAMIRELGNVELFELCETTPKLQCSQCLLYWNQGIVYCTCGQCLIYSESRRKFFKLRLDAISIPDNVIKKGHGARHGKTEVQREYHMAWNAWKRCCEKVDHQGEHFAGIHDRFLRDPVCRESQLAIGWSEQKCKEWDEFAQENHTYKLTPEERRRYKGQWYLTLNKAGKNGLYTTNQENQLKSLSIQVNKDEYNNDVQFSLMITSPAPELINTQDGSIGLHLQLPRGGTHLNGVGSELTFFFFAQISFCYSWFRLQSIAIHCKWRGVWTEHPHTTLFLDTFILVHIKVSHNVSA